MLIRLFSKMDKAEINLTGYDNVEKISNFKNDDELKQYRKDKLDEVLSRVKFIKKSFDNEKLINKINVLELGSGNSKLLYQLDNQNFLNKGYGVEISKSRYEFAEKWKKDLNIKNIENINENVLDLDMKRFGTIDLIICVDLILQFLEPIKKNSIQDILKNMEHTLSDDGCIILELWSFKNILKKINQNNGLFKTWMKFGDSDPFSFVIESLETDDEDFIIWNKHFIHKHRLIDDERNIMRNVLKPYSPQEITKLLNNAGFNEIKIFKNSECESYDENQDEYLVLAKR